VISPQSRRSNFPYAEFGLGDTEVDLALHAEKRVTATQVFNAVERLRSEGTTDNRTPSESVSCRCVFNLPSKY
jgi:hypothetical protein